ncbi:hypothetical protein Pmani_029415 [Petrolisthes manimaculis]|uniref:Lipase n=1 Tax=Petrolisthes manimaculis TaxID=1843537 RepID=A0AAE1TUH9_9EUCA|nr:hypothetical protein Pmani_029415 [Petrolisthes manimaculis]
MVVVWVKGNYNPDIYLDVPELIKKYGYPVESHQVVTEDGFILTLHRIPHGRHGDIGGENRVQGRHPVFLQHGLLSSSACWLMAEPDKALAYIAADAGYDVWMGNTRGNHYSRNHTSLQPSNKEFWDFSYDEMGYYDLPAVIDYVLTTTEHSKLAYVGHSMGTTMFFAFLSSRPEYANKIRVMFGLAPVARVDHTKSTVLRDIAYRYRTLEDLFEVLHGYEFLPHNELVIKWTEELCTPEHTKELICLSAIFRLTGIDYPQFNLTWLPTILSHTPEGTSIRTMAHYAQGINTGKFRHYDFGWFYNLRRYGQITPPEYSLSDVKVPIVLFWSKNDYLADTQDVSWLASQLPHVVINYEVPYPKFNHIDFVWGIDALKYVYKPLLKYIAFF